MRVVYAKRFLFSLATLSIAMGCQAKAACRLGVVAAFPLHIEGSQALIDVTINGGSARLLVDTGSASTLIGRPAAAKLGLHVTALEDDRYRFQGVGGEDVASQTIVKELKLGDSVMANVKMIVSGPGLKSSTYVGLLGEDILGNFDLELDFPHSVMRMIRPTDCMGDQVAYWAKAYSMAPLAPSYTGRDIQFFVLLNGRRTLAVLDTGAYASVATVAAAADAKVLHSPDTHAAGQVGGLGSHAEDNFVAIFPTITIGDETIRNQKLFIADLFRKDKEVQLGSRIAKPTIDLPGMLLGTDFIKAHRIYVARSQQKIYFSYEGGQVFAANDTQANNSPPTSITAKP